MRSRRTRRTRRIVLTVAAACSLALVAACGPPAPAPPAPPIASTPQADDVVVRTNDARSGSGIGTMVVDGNMQANAQTAAGRVANRLRTCSDLRASDHSAELGSWYAGYSAAENLACVPGCPPDGAQVMRLWWDSALHRNNMMNPAYTYTGTAAYCVNNLMVVVGQYRSG